jgi:hypothetical protein
MRMRGAARWLIAAAAVLSAPACAVSAAAAREALDKAMARGDYSTASNMAWQMLGNATLDDG